MTTVDPAPAAAGASSMDWRHLADAATLAWVDYQVAQHAAACNPESVYAASRMEQAELLAELLEAAAWWSRATARRTATLARLRES